MHFSILLIFSTSFIFSVVQWRKTKHDPRARAALRWFLLSIYTATGLFAALIIIPAALHIPQPAPQGLMFGAFLIMYWGLALGIVKYRLFQLEQWWHSITGWFISGVFIVVCDILMVSAFSLPQDLALPMAVALAGWVYFPLRQLLWHRIGRQTNQNINVWIEQILPLLIDKDTAQESQPTSERWLAILRVIWRTPHVTMCADNIATAVIENEGLTLRVPAYPLNQAFHFKIDLPDAGARLFTSVDIKTVSSLQQIAGLALERIEARNQGMQVERDRIRRDMHDDLGATLLTLLHVSQAEHKPLARAAINDMRNLVSTLEQLPVNKQQAIAHWHKEITERCQFAQVELSWDASAENLPEFLSARTYTNLARIVREAITNSLKYSGEKKLAVSIREQDIMVVNVVQPNALTAMGNGLRIMRERAAEINAELIINERDGIFTLQIRLTNKGN